MDGYLDGQKSDALTGIDGDHRAVLTQRPPIGRVVPHLPSSEDRARRVGNHRVIYDILHALETVLLAGLLCGVSPSTAFYSRSDICS